ncbi:ABC transporter ATP-binding protein [Leptothermofonsia sp. ETS-13]|uniref:ABC transporter ATP-binding protein n=1 Tax=Leptothermofonsia sp. ETS-13 TaxID=3035696 RepID=UPI003B9EE6BB
MVKTLNQNDQEQILTAADDIVLSVNGVSKKFCRDLKRSLLYGVQDITADLVGLRKESDRLRPKEFWALQNVSFQLRRGEALGLVGKNGSGKSTLLRVIAGLIKPDTGSVDVYGRIAPLIALSAGFNPILTGRENIYANMSILGLSQQEIDERFDQVVEFAEIGDAIDAPVQTYSSGMTARLGFACAIHTEPDILLIDEVLAVGDAKFRSKCTRKLAELRAKGTSFIFVSHNSMAIMAVSNSAIYLQKGALIASGSPEKIIEMYEEDLFLNSVKVIQGVMHIPEKSSTKSSGIDITSVYFRDQKGNILNSLRSGESAIFCTRFKAHQGFKNVSLRVEVHEVSGENETVLFLSGWLDQQLFDVVQGTHEIQMQMPYIGFKPGVYTASINLRKDSNYIFDTIESFNFVVKGDSSMSKCKFYQPRSWDLVSNLEEV